MVADVVFELSFVLGVIVRVMKMTSASRMSLATRSK